MAAAEVSAGTSELHGMEGTEAASGARGKYRLIAELGHGGMARVFLALAQGPQGFNKLVVIKQMREEMVSDPDLLAMFLDEARLAARLNHPNVVQTNEVFEERRHYFICMEYLEGQPLKRILQRAGREGLPLGLHLRILSEILSGLQHAHELCDYDGTPLQVVHRDVTPSNVFVTYAGQVKVVDFGIAKVLGQSTETRTGVIKGKIVYMAPEQARSEPVDRRADIFSVGVMMWEALAGRRLFEGLCNVSIIQRLVGGQIESPRAVCPTADEGLAAVCMKALAYDRDARYDTAADFQTAIDQALDATGDRSSLRDAGKLLSRRFERDRAALQALVEAELSSSRRDPRTCGEPPFVDADAVHRDSAPRAGIVPVLPPPPSHGGSSRDEHAGPLTSQHTDTGTLAEAALVAATPAPAATRQGNNRLAFQLGVVGVAAALLMGYFAGVRRQTSVEAAQPTSAQPTSAAPAKSRHTLVLRSYPPGATVKEGDRVLGTTPLLLALDESQQGPRELVVSLDGFIDHTLRQEPAAADIEITTALTRTEAPVSAPAAAGPATRGQRHGPAVRQTRPVATATRPVQPPPPAPAGSLDIHYTR